MRIQKKTNRNKKPRRLSTLGDPTNKNTKNKQLPKEIIGQKADNKKNKNKKKRNPQVKSQIQAFWLGSLRNGNQIWVQESRGSISRDFSLFRPLKVVVDVAVDSGPFEFFGQVSSIFEKFRNLENRESEVERSRERRQMAKNLIFGLIQAFRNDTIFN